METCPVVPEGDLPHFHQEGWLGNIVRDPLDLGRFFFPQSLLKMRQGNLANVEGDDVLIAVCQEKIDEGGGPSTYIQDRRIFIQSALFEKFQGNGRIGFIPAELGG